MKQSRRGLRQQIDSAMFFKIEKFPAEDPVRGLGQGVPRMTAAASLRDSSSALEADLGKGGVLPHPRCIPQGQERGLRPPPDVMLIRMTFPPRKRKQGAEPPSKSHAHPHEVSTPRHFRTAQRGGYASGISAAGVAFVAEAIPVSPSSGHANLVQFGYAPREPSALPVEPIDQGAFHIPLEPSTAP